VLFAEQAQAEGKTGIGICAGQSFPDFAALNPGYLLMTHCVSRASRHSITWSAGASSIEYLVRPSAENLLE
jgi:hypothetical protein